MKRKYLVLVICALFLAIALLLYGALFSLNSERGDYAVRTLHIQGSVWYGPHLQIQVSPLGYPQAGQYWTIDVYLVNLTYPSRVPTCQPALNSTVIVSVSQQGIRRDIELSVDENGKASFQNQATYDDIAFQAYDRGLPPSSVIVVSTRYISPAIVDQLLGMNILSLVGSLASNWLAKTGKTEKTSRLILRTGNILLVLAICLFGFVFFTASYSRFFQETIWGAPEDVVGSIITITFLIYAFYVAAVVLFVYWVLKLVVKGLAGKESS